MEVSSEGEGSRPPRYALDPIRICGEDILFCVDVDAESLAEMKATGSNGRPFTRLDSIKQAILLFVHSKLSINPDNRFAFATLSKSASWLRRDFSSDVDSVMTALRGLSATTHSDYADLTHLFRSSTKPVYQWTSPQKLFTFDVMYLHDKPGPDNCPQDVYDALVYALEAVSEHEGYIVESGQGLTRVVLRQICVLLSHPQQRCPQDFVDFPKPLLAKKPPPPSEPTTGTAGEENVPISIQ